MPRCFFHLHDGTDRPDHEGVELTDRREAWSMATQTVSKIIRVLDGKHRPGGG